jgi:AcrR family transcriptional regulator
MSDDSRNIVSIDGRDRRPWAVVTRERLLQATVSEIAARGYDHARLVDIAQRADLTVGAIYNWFANKAELFAAAIEYALTEQRDHNLTYLDDKQVSARVGIVANHWLMMVAALAPRQGGDRGPTDAQRTLLEALRMAWRDEEVQKSIQPQVAGILEQYEQVIDQGKRDGQIDDELDTRLLARILLAIPAGLSSLTLAGMPDLDPKLYLAVLTRLNAALQPSKLARGENESAD